MENSLYLELKDRIEHTYNSNFYANKLDNVTDVWIKEMCLLIDIKLNSYKKLNVFDTEGYLY